MFHVPFSTSLLYLLALLPPSPCSKSKSRFVERIAPRAAVQHGDPDSGQELNQNKNREVLNGRVDLSQERWPKRNSQAQLLKQLIDREGLLPRCSTRYCTYDSDYLKKASWRTPTSLDSPSTSVDCIDEPSCSGTADDDTKLLEDVFAGLAAEEDEVIDLVESDDDAALETEPREPAAPPCRLPDSKWALHKGIKRELELEPSTSRSTSTFSTPVGISGIIEHGTAGHGTQPHVKRIKQELESEQSCSFSAPPRNIAIKDEVGYGTQPHMCTPTPQITTPDPQLSKRLRTEHEQSKATREYARMFESRRRLPVFGKTRDVLRMVDDNQVVILPGETGCGKSTQVPQMLLDAGRGAQTHVVVTQPRRISAISLAQRVAEERAERLGRSVGYKVRLDSVDPRPRRSILYYTTGIVLRS